jgi:hypothetical protein
MLMIGYKTLLHTHLRMGRFSFHVHETIHFSCGQFCQYQTVDVFETTSTTIGMIEQTNKQENKLVNRDERKGEIEIGEREGGQEGERRERTGEERTINYHSPSNLVPSLAK